MRSGTTQAKQVCQEKKVLQHKPQTTQTNEQRQEEASERWYAPCVIHQPALRQVRVFNAQNPLLSLFKINGSANKTQPVTNTPSPLCDTGKTIKKKTP